MRILISHRLCVGSLVPTNGYLASTLMAREPDGTRFIRVPRFSEGS
jgi:hypothetical protein